jgi:hypothetical protein
MNPLPTAVLDGRSYAVHPNLLVVVAPNRKYQCEFAELANQLTQPTQLGGTVHQVTAQQHHIRIARGHGIQHLAAQRFGATVSDVDVADIQQSTRIVPCRESFLANVQGSTQPDLQRSAEPLPSRVRRPLATRALDQ